MVCVEFDPNTNTELLLTTRRNALTVQTLMHFAWQVAHGMTYIAANRVCETFAFWGCCSVVFGFIRDLLKGKE